MKTIKILLMVGFFCISQSIESKLSDDKELKEKFEKFEKFGQSSPVRFIGARLSEKKVQVYKNVKDANEELVEFKKCLDKVAWIAFMYSAYAECLEDSIEDANWMFSVKKSGKECAEKFKECLEIYKEYLSSK